MTISTNRTYTYFDLCLLYPVPAVWIFYFQDGDVTNPAGLASESKCKSGPMPPYRAKKWRQKSTNPALFPRMSPGSPPRMAADKCINDSILYFELGYC